MSSYFSVRRLPRGERVGVLRQLLASARSRRMAAAALVWFGLVTAAEAHETVRMSMASAEAAEQRRQTASTLGFYNLKLGPTMWALSAGLGAGYNDNINYSPNHPEDDFVFRPELDARMLWPVSDVNSLNLSLGAGYSIYAKHSSFDRFFVVPGSELSFDIYVRDVWVNLHDRLSIIDNTYQDPNFAGTGDYQLLQNTIGTTATWDLNKVILKFGYDHQDNVSLTGNLPIKNEQAELLSTSAGFMLKPGMQTGLELGGALVHFTPSGNITPYDATQWNAGPFFESQLSEHLRFRASAGYTVFSPDGRGLLGNSSEGFYAQASLTHHINQYVDYTLSGGRNISYSYYGGSFDSYFAYLSANWRIVQKTDLVTSFNYSTGTQVFSVSEDYDWYGPSIRVRRLITEKLTGSLGWQYYWRTSNRANADYTVSVVGLNLEYRF